MVVSAIKLADIPFDDNYTTLLCDVSMPQTRSLTLRPPYDLCTSTWTVLWWWHSVLPMVSPLRDRPHPQTRFMATPASWYLLSTCPLFLLQLTSLCWRGCPRIVLRQVIWVPDRYLWLVLLNSGGDVCSGHTRAVQYVALLVRIHSVLGLVDVTGVWEGILECVC